MFRTLSIFKFMFQGGRSNVEVSRFRNNSTSDYSTLKIQPGLINLDNSTPGYCPHDLTIDCSMLDYSTQDYLKRLKCEIGKF